jgi:hypothetical protein
MRFYQQLHRFYCGIDLHATTMYVGSDKVSGPGSGAFSGKNKRVGSREPFRGRAVGGGEPTLGREQAQRWPARVPQASGSRSRARACRKKCLAGTRRCQ